MKPSDNFKFRFDEQTGIFIRESEISVNWLLNQVLCTENLQITKISNEEIRHFLYILSQSDLRLPNGQYCLVWLKEQLKEKMLMSGSKDTEAWEKVTERYRYILEQIDLSLITVKDLEQKLKTVDVKDEYKIKRDPNNLEAFFEPL
jgi:hypothetical protein